ncbi:hypothetical protein GCM10009864_39150 [Streptomyces lunalinharesii]|uniref:Uncharacterized protein n=1 Tax=Streptomyces lunalinharesii TaxID=333384 RepID=A0ABP6EIQ0_9ACTN
MLRGRACVGNRIARGRSDPRRTEGNPPGPRLRYPHRPPKIPFPADFDGVKGARAARARERAVPASRAAEPCAAQRTE